MDIQKIYRNTEFGQSAFVIDWMLHNRCTYDCSYCPPPNKEGDDNWLSISTVTTFIEHLENYIRQVDPQSKIYCLFTGGEPTVWKGFNDILDIVSNRGWGIKISTNGSRSVNWWKDNAKKFNRIFMSYHSEHANDDEFIEKAKICSQYVPTHVNIMMNTNIEYFDKCIKFSKRIWNETENVSIAHQHIQHSFGNQYINVPLYTTEQQDILSNLEGRFVNLKQIYNIDPIENYFYLDSQNKSYKLNGSQVIKTNSANFRGWKCNVGLESIFIDSKGYVKRGTCRAGGILGNITDPENIIWPTSSIICPYTWCGCMTDILNTKEKIKK